jgi:Cytochrome P460
MLARADEGELMTSRFALTAFCAALALLPAPVRAGGEKIAFPANHADGTLYTTVDRADNKQFRELFVSPPSALEAAKRGEPLPHGTVLTLVQYRALLDEAGNPKKDANGRFIKGEVAGYTVMEKRAGWGAEYPPELRNGEWEYQAFTPAKAVNEKANLTACFQCHKPLDKQDFVFSYDKLKAAAR